MIQGSDEDRSHTRLEVVLNWFEGNTLSCPDQHLYGDFTGPCVEWRVFERTHGGKQPGAADCPVMSTLSGSLPSKTNS